MTKRPQYQTHDRLAKFVGPVPVTLKDPEGKDPDQRQIYEGWYHPGSVQVVPVRVIWQRPTDEEIAAAIEASLNGQPDPGIKIRRYQTNQDPPEIIPPPGETVEGEEVDRTAPYGITDIKVTAFGPADAPPVNRPKFDTLRKAANELTFWTVAAAVVAAVELARRIRK